MLGPGTKQEWQILKQRLSCLENPDLLSANLSRTVASLHVQSGIVCMGPCRRALQLQQCAAGMLALGSPRRGPQLATAPHFLAEQRFLLLHFSFVPREPSLTREQTTSTNNTALHEPGTELVFSSPVLTLPFLHQEG